jgi:ABC-type phosphate transport system substrate-binding protein
VFETVASLEGDNQTGSALVKDVVDLGISDVEPTAFIGTNYGSEYTFIPYAAPTKAKLQTISAYGAIVGEVYAPIVSNAGATSGYANSSGFGTAGLTSQELATIYSGGATDWANVPSAAATGASGAITICRRDAGSGTQVVTSEHFLGTNCNSAGLPFLAASKAGVTVVTNFATADVLSCVQTHPGSIGLVTVQTAAKYTGAGATQITVDGVLGTAISSAQGKYTYYAEAWGIKEPAHLTGNPLQLANTIINDLKSASKVPASASVPNLVAIPGATNIPFSPVTPLKAGQQIPIAIGTNSGNSCGPLIDQLL